MQNLQRIGQSLVELVIIIVLLVTITIGAVEFGYDFFLLHMITQATSADSTSVQTFARSEIGPFATVARVDVLQIDPPCANTLPCPTLTTIPKVSVTVAGSFPSIFGLLGSTTINFTRTGTFRDEGR